MDPKSDHDVQILIQSLIDQLAKTKFLFCINAMGMVVAITPRCCKGGKNVYKRDADENVFNFSLIL